MKNFYLYTAITFAIVTGLLIGNYTAKADEQSDVKEKLIRLALLSCMSGVERAVKEYEAHDVKIKIKSGPELCSDLLKGL